MTKEFFTELLRGFHQIWLILRIARMDTPKHKPLQKGVSLPAHRFVLTEEVERFVKAAELRISVSSPGVFISAPMEIELEDFAKHLKVLAFCIFQNTGTSVCTLKTPSQRVEFAKKGAAVYFFLKHDYSSSRPE